MRFRRMDNLGSIGILFSDPKEVHLSCSLTFTVLVGTCCAVLNIV